VNTGLPAPTETQLGGIGAPQACWLDLMDAGVDVTALPSMFGPEQGPRVMLRVGIAKRPLTFGQVAELQAILSAAVEWCGGRDGAVSHG